MKTILKMKQFNFDNLEVVTKKCLYISDNKAITRNKRLFRIVDIVKDENYKNLYVEELLRDCRNNNDMSEVYLDLGIICLYVNSSIYYNSSIEDIKRRLGHITNLTLEMVIKNIYDRKNNNQFINVADIKLIELSGASKEEVQELIDYRQAWYNRKEKEEQEKKRQREQADKEFVVTKNKEVDDLVLAAEQAILNKQEVKNSDITIYKSRYDSHDMSLILYMMKKYNINVPLKTQGWINQALYSIQYNKEWNDYSYKYYKSSANSTVFNKYLAQLVKAIQENNKVAITAQQEE